MNLLKLLKMKKKLIFATCLSLLALLCVISYHNESANLLFESNVEALVSGDNYSGDIVDRYVYGRGDTEENSQIYVTVDFGTWCAENGDYNPKDYRGVCKVIIF